MVFVAANRAHGQFFSYYSWIDPGGGTYQGASNWLPFGVPDNLSEVAGFDLDAVYMVNFFSDVNALGAH